MTFKCVRCDSLYLEEEKPPSPVCWDCLSEAHLQNSYREIMGPSGASLCAQLDNRLYADFKAEQMVNNLLGEDEPCEE